MKIYIRRLTFLFFLIPAGLNAQILQDSASLHLVKKGIDYIYNYQFTNAEQIYVQLNKTYPDHPVMYLFKGMLTYWENYPLLPTSSAYNSFENDLRKCIELTEGNKTSDSKAELLLTDLSARGLLLLFYSDNDMTWEVIPLATSTYQYIRKSFNYTSVYNDFRFFTGLYNYYREAYPEAYPVYKMLAFLFPRGDRYKGLADLQSVARSSILFKAEASSFLSSIYLSFEDDFKKAFDYSLSLHELYPGNVEYLAMYIKNLLLIKRYDEAEEHIKALPEKHSGNDSYFQAQVKIFNGILQEKKYHNNKLAEQYYKKGIDELLAFGYFGNEFSAYAYFGLSRINALKGDETYTKIYRKKANDLADFKKVDFDD